MRQRDTQLKESGTGERDGHKEKEKREQEEGGDKGKIYISKRDRKNG